MYCMFVSIIAQLFSCWFACSEVWSAFVVHFILLPNINCRPGIALLVLLGKSCAILWCVQCSNGCSFQASHAPWWWVKLERGGTKSTWVGFVSLSEWAEKNTITIYILMIVLEMWFLRHSKQRYNDIFHCHAKMTVLWLWICQLFYHWSSILLFNRHTHKNILLRSKWILSSHFIRMTIMLV